MKENLLITQLMQLIGGYEGARDFAQGLLAEATEGEISAIRMKAYLTLVIDTLSAVKDADDLRRAVINESDFFENGVVEDKYFIAKRGEFGVKYDYSACNYSVLTRAVEDESKAKKQRVEAEKLLKAHSKSWVDDETGEVIFPPVKTSITNVSITIKK